MKVYQKYSICNVDRVQMSINCVSRGGPVTEFSYFKDCAVIPLESGSAYSQLREITAFSSADFHISLKGY